MTNDEMQQLQPGDTVRHKATGVGYIVTANYGSYVALVRTAQMTHPPEWEVVRMAVPQQSESNRTPKP